MRAIAASLGKLPALKVALNALQAAQWRTLADRLDTLEDLRALIETTLVSEPPLTLADGFNPCSSITSDTFAVDPNFRVGYAQTWQVAVQRDLPKALQLTATYLGVKGTRGVQQFLPNTYPIGATTPCALCPVGFTYRTSGGNSIRNAGTLQLRRRLRSGFLDTHLANHRVHVQPR